MNRETFSKLVADPSVVADENGAELNAFAERYPWCQTGHLLLCVLEHRQQTPTFNERLKRAAVHTVNREVLFNLLMRPSLEATVKAFEGSVADEERAPEEAEDATSAESFEATPVAQEKTSTDLEPSSAEPTNLPQERPEASEVEQPVEESPEPRMRAADLDDLQREIVLEAISSTIKKEVDEAKEEHEEERDLAKARGAQTEVPDKEVDELTGTHLDEVSTEKEEEVVQAENIAPNSQTEQAEDHAQRSPYANWLLAHTKRASHEPASNAQKGEPTSAEAEEAPEKVDPKTKQLSIIDRFIQTDPKITPGKADLFSTENLAKMSLVEDEEFVTETMAMIYARQGNVKKALKAYKLLSLKYPEKSIYFANQIKKLRDDGDRSKKQ